MEKIKILAIAPYESMKTMILQVAGRRPDVDISVFVGNLEDGVKITREYSRTDFDAIISRGGTAELIRQQTALPVVEIPLSVYDILRSIKLAENYNNKYVIIGFPAVTKNAHFLCDVLRYDIDIFTIHNEGEARERLQDLSKNGCDMVLCDMITNSLAKQYGISSILITSGTESIETAVEQAVQISLTGQAMKHRIHFFRSILEERKESVFVYTDAQELVYSFNVHTFPDPVLEKITSAIDLVLTETKRRFYFENSGYLYTVSGVRKTIGAQTYAVFFINTRRTFHLSKNGISFIDKEEAYDGFFNSIYGIIQSSILNNMTLEQYAQSGQALMIAGEIGTGKEQMAKLAYAKSRLSNNPLVVVDCSRLHERGWSFLLENEHSPFNDSGITIYIKGIKCLTDAQFTELVDSLKDLDVYQRDRLLFTDTCDAKKGYSDRCRTLINVFSCLTIMMPALRTQKENIPNLASLYISILNMKLAKEIIGFEPQAIEGLEAFDWPYNFDQFKRIISELVTVTDSSYIRLSSVDEILRREQKLTGLSAAEPFDLNRTLQDITLDIIRQVLAQEHGNQSAAAKRLGISRATLWRMLRN